MPMRLNPKLLLVSALVPGWGRARAPAEGYAVLVPTPMDMPFLLRYALEGLATIRTPSCRRILVVPDGSGAGDGEVLRSIVERCGDPRVVYAPLGPGLRTVVGQVRKRLSGSAFANWAHWATIVEAVRRSEAEYLFLHDADAFFLDGDGLERQYLECRRLGMWTLGIQARLDEFFGRIGFAMPGTWELMLSVPWARRQPPLSLKGQWRDTPDGRQEFDTLLYRQYLDRQTGKIGVMADPPRLVHFHGTVTTYRTYRDRAGQGVVDEVFRLLLLSVLEELVPGAAGERILPPPSELARGLKDPPAPIRYDTPRAAREYPAFRGQIDELCDSPTFAGARAERIREMLRPFDENFAAAGPAPDRAADLAGRPRRHGLG